jgi:hypothetical protein
MTLRLGASNTDNASGQSGMLPYSRLPGNTRITCERTATGVRLFLPELGTWHHAKWGLLFGSWMILPQTALLIFAVRKMGPQVMERIWKPLLIDATLLPFFGVIAMSFLVGFVLGRIRTSLVIDADSLTLVRELWGMRGTKSWKKDQLKDVRTFFKHIRIVSKKAILRTQFGVASTHEAKWLAKCLREELGMVPAAPPPEQLQRSA